MPESRLHLRFGLRPGHIARYLQEFNPAVIGLDLSLGLLRQARLRHPDILFLQSDLLALPFASGTLAGTVAFYSTIHFGRIQLNQAFAEIERVLQPAGHLLLGFHVGTDTVHVDELWGVPVDLDTAFFPMDDLAGRLAGRGFGMVEQFQRDPYPEVEYPRVRGYIWGVKPG